MFVASPSTTPAWTRTSSGCTRTAPPASAGSRRTTRRRKGWLDIAYNHVFCRHGYVFVGRGFGVRSAANGTAESNDAYFAVCFLGDDSVGRADVTPAARRALTDLIAKYRRRYPRANEVRPHWTSSPPSVPVTNSGG